MKKIVKAFTLIELLVVTAIITLISSAGGFYFLDFVQEQEIGQKLYIVEGDIKELDKQVKDYEIFDYEMYFSISTRTSLSKLYKVYTNIFDSNESQTILTVNSSYVGSISSGTYNGDGIIKIYENNKLLINETIDRDPDYPYTFNSSQNYKISGTASGEVLNDIYIKFYSEDNLSAEENNNLELVEINTQEDKNGINISSLKVTNVGGIKKFYNSGIEDSSINKVFLFFENNGKGKYIKLEK